MDDERGNGGGQKSCHQPALDKVGQHISLIVSAVDL